MRDRLIKFAFVVFFSIGASYSVYSSKSETKISDLALDNVEALAYEWGGTNCFWQSPGNWYSCIPWGNGLGCPCGM